MLITQRDLTLDKVAEIADAIVELPPRLRPQQQYKPQTRRPLMIRVLVVIGLLAVARGEESECGEGRATVKGRCYEEEVLIDDIHFIRNLVMNRYTDVIYFITNYHRNPTACYLDLGNHDGFGGITQVSGASAYAVDQDRHEVYLTGDGQVYKYYHNNNTVERVGSSGRYHVYSMFYKDVLYYTNRHLYTLRNGESTEVENMKGTVVLTYAIDGDGYQFFTNSSALYGKMRGSEKVDLYKTGLFPGGVQIDLNGTPYTCQHGHLYFVNKDKKELEKVGTLNDNCSELAFDKNNKFIYSTHDKIKRLKAVDLPVLRNNDE